VGGPNIKKEGDEGRGIRRRGVRERETEIARRSYGDVSYKDKKR